MNSFGIRLLWGFAGYPSLDLPYLIAQPLDLTRRIGVQRCHDASTALLVSRYRDQPLRVLAGTFRQGCVGHWSLHDPRVIHRRRHGSDSDSRCSRVVELLFNLQLPIVQTTDPGEIDLVKVLLNGFRAVAANLGCESICEVVPRVEVVVERIQSTLNAVQLLLRE